jgi:hypothetical protein
MKGEDMEEGEEVVPQNIHPHPRVGDGLPERWEKEMRGEGREKGIDQYSSRGLPLACMRRRPSFSRMIARGG